MILKDIVKYCLPLFCLFYVIFSTFADNDEEKIEKLTKAVASKITKKLPSIQISIKGLKDGAQLKNVENFLDIYQEKNKSVVNYPYIRYLAKLGVEQIKQSLQPFGYYLTEVKLRIDEGIKKWQVNYNIKRGKPLVVAKQEIIIQGEGKDHPDFVELLKAYPLKKGDILEQKKYKEFKDDLSKIAITNGYFDAKFVRNEILLAEDFLSADIYITYYTGTRYKFGDVNLLQDFLDQDMVDRYKIFLKGGLYSLKEINTLQHDLYNSGYIKTIDLVSEPDKVNKVVPVTLKLIPKKNKLHTFSIGYGTDTGFRGGYNFNWRWVNRYGHQFESNIFASQKKLKTGLEYNIPGDRPAYDQYKFFINHERELDNHNKKNNIWNIGGLYHDINGSITREFGVKFQKEKFSVGSNNGNVKFLVPYVRFIYRKVNDPVNIKDGVNINLELAATRENFFSDVSFLQAIGKAKLIKTFANVNRIKLSAGVGRTWTWNKGFYNLPVSYRFFTGGDKSIRGYKFESIGDRDSKGKVIGGNKMYYFSSEYEYFFRKNMAAAVFVDAGNAYYSQPSKLKVGAGLGFHYYSPIGPIKIDVAHGFNKPGDRLRLHFSIGAEF